MYPMRKREPRIRYARLFTSTERKMAPRASAGKMKHEYTGFLFVLTCYIIPHMDERNILFVLGGVIVLLVLWIVRLEVRLARLMRGGHGKSLEEHIRFAKQGVEELRIAKKEVENFLAELHERVRKGVSRVETLRFNPFRGDGSGGNQSFVTALLDDHGNGVILSGIYSREKVNVYAKPVKEFASEIQLSDEEREVLERIRK